MSEKENNLEIKKEQEALNSLILSDEKSIDEMEDVYEESMVNLKVGNILEGEIVSIHDNFIFVSVGTKSEGMIKKEEFNSDVKEGDKIKVLVLGLEGRDGRIVLSKKRADYIINKKKVIQSFEEGIALKGNIIKEVKGGYTVSIKGFQAFLPYSHIHLPRYSGNDFNTKEYMNKEFNFKVIQYDYEKNSAVVSIKAYLEEQKKKQNEVFFEKYKIGDVIEGTIKKIFDYGSIVYLGYYMDAFLHLRDLSWNFVRSFKEFGIEEGKKIKVKIIDINKEESKVQVGIKQFKEDPFSRFLTEYKEGDIVSGEVYNILKNGVLVYTQNITAFIPQEELAWNYKFININSLIKKGDQIKIKILEIQKDNKRVLASLKDLIEDPWSYVERDFPRGQKVEFKIKKVFPQRLLLMTKNGIHGFLHVKNFDWEKDIETIDFEKIFKKNETIDLIILGYNHNKQYLILGKKQLEKSPLKIFYEKLQKNESLEVEVVEIIEEGLRVKLKDEKNLKRYDAIVPKQEMIIQKNQSLESLYKEGDTFKVTVKFFDFQKEMIILSKRNYDKQEEKNLLKSYTHNQEKSTKVTLKDIFNSKNINLKG